MLIYIYLLVPAQHELQKLQHTERALKKQVDSVNKWVAQQGLMSIKSIGENKNNAGLLTDLGALAQMNRLHLQAVTHLREKDRIKLQVSGDYASMLMLLYALSKQQMLYVGDFAVKSAKNTDPQLSIEVAIINLSAKLSIFISPANSAKSIFCDFNKTIQPSSNSEYIFPINQIKMVGYMDVASTPFAFVELPDGTEHQVKVGSMIGIEKARIINITNTQIKLKTITGEIYTLTMQEIE